MLALEAALTSPTPDDAALARALLFRARRLQAATPAERDRERLLELAEGCAEYTGWALSAAPARTWSRRWRTRRRTRPWCGPSPTPPAPRTARSCRIATRAGGSHTVQTQDLPKLLALTLEPISAAWAQAALDGGAEKAAVDTKAQHEGAAFKLDAIRKDEEHRWAARQKQLTELKARFVSGPTLRIRPAELRLTFDYRASVPLGDAGTVLAAVGWKTEAGADLAAPRRRARSPPAGRRSGCRWRRASTSRRARWRRRRTGRGPDGP